MTRSRTARRLFESARFGKRRANSNRYAAQRLPASPMDLTGNALPFVVTYGVSSALSRRFADIHVSLSQEEAMVFLGRSRERPKQCLQDS